MIGIVKTALYKVMPAGELSEEELRTLFCEVEGLVNNRPLCLLPSNDPHDLPVLTPGHFLLGDRIRQLGVLPHGQDFPWNRRWFVVQSLLDEFWARFVREIIPQMHVMNKWVRDRPNIEVDDVVILFEEKARGRWPLARVVSVRATLRDGHVRTVDIRHRGKILTRSVHDILRLDAVTQDSGHLLPELPELQSE